MTIESDSSRREFLGALSAGVGYHVAVEAFNENGVSPLGKRVTVH